MNQNTSETLVNQQPLVAACELVTQLAAVDTKDDLERLTVQMDEAREAVTLVRFRLGGTRTWKERVAKAQKILEVVAMEAEKALATERLLSWGASNQRGLVVVG